MCCRKLVCFSLICLSVLAIRAFSVTPGRSYFGANNYVEYIPGTLPLIISAPHGGNLNPSSIPDRTCPSATTVTDSYTEELVREIDSACLDAFGCRPHIILSHLSRKKLDPNRDVQEATCGNVTAEKAYREFHGFIDTAENIIEQIFGKGLYLDIHGHGHTIQRLEIGYLLGQADLQLPDTILNKQSYVSESSIRNLVANNKGNLNLVNLLRGPKSLGALLSAKGFPAVPSPAVLFPKAGETYFSGGYNTEVHGSKISGTIDGIQIECNMSGVRDTKANRKKFADSLTASLQSYFTSHYFASQELNKCRGAVNVASGAKRLKSACNVYANKNRIAIQMLQMEPNLSITIYNSNGRKLHDLQNHSVNTIHVKPGLYIVSLKDRNEVYTQKIAVHE